MKQWTQKVMNNLPSEEEIRNRLCENLREKTALRRLLKLALDAKAWKEAASVGEKHKKI